MTAVAEDLGLSWVTFTGDHRDSCRWKVDGSCSLEAVAEATWDKACCEKSENPQKLCAPHRDYVLAGSPSGFFRCIACRSRVRLVRMEPIQ